MFKWYLARVEKEIEKNLKCLRLDRGEFTLKEFEMFCNKKRNQETKINTKDPSTEWNC